MVAGCRCSPRPLGVGPLSGGTWGGGGGLVALAVVCGSRGGGGGGGGGVGLTSANLLTSRNREHGVWWFNSSMLPRA